MRARLRPWGLVGVLSLALPWAPGAGTAGALAAVVLQPVISNLVEPVHVTHARDGSGRLFVAEQAGRIKVLSPGGVATIFLDITGRVLRGGERGLLGLAFHPGYAATGRFFVNYTRRPDGAIVVAEYRISPGNPNVAQPGERVLLVIPHPLTNHNGGMLEFGPDGYLYVSTGDGGASPGSPAQNPGDLLGKILRIDVDSAQGGPGQASYASPGDNPFAGAHPGRDEIWALGFRNPWRLSFDRLTGELYVGDVGQREREEIDRVVRGGNYGWPIFEGSVCHGPGSSCADPVLRGPIAEYTHDGDRCAVTGGYVYRGSAGTLPTGTYVFGDHCTGEVFGLQNGVVSALSDTGLAISSFGEDEAGELYVVGLGGTVHRLVGGDTVALALGADRALLDLGDRLHVGLSLATGAVAVVADVYAGLLSPGGSVVFLTSLEPPAGVTTSLAADARTFAPLARALVIPAGAAATLEDFLVHTPTAGDRGGTYVVFVVLTRPGALDDGRVDAGDVLALTAWPFTLLK